MQVEVITEPSWTAMQWIASFETFSMGEPLISTRSDLPENNHCVTNQLGRSTTTPVPATTFNLYSSECVVGSITKVPVTQLSSVQQSNPSSSQLPTAKRTSYIFSSQLKVIF